MKGWIKNAIQKPSALCLGWDEFVNIHTYQRPRGSQTATIAQMVTIVAHAPNHTAIPFDPNRPHHNPAGPIDPDLFIPFLLSFDFFAAILSNFPPATRDHLVGENMLEVITAYYAKHAIGHEEYMKNTVIINISKQNFHSIEDFTNIWKNRILSTELKGYLDQYLAIAPGDYHAQRHARDAIRLKMWKEANPENEAPDQRDLPYIDHIIPINGTLHTALNHAESIFMSSRWICNGLWKWMKPSKKINKSKPRPWEITLTLSIMYGAWTLVRTQILSKFNGQAQRTLPFAYLYDFLENQCGLQFFWYDYIVKRKGDLTEILQGMAQIWLQMTLRNRRHYKFSILETICLVLFLDRIKQPDGQILPQHPLYGLFQQHARACLDEYHVENKHWIIWDRI